MIENKLQNNTDYNTNTRFSLENHVKKSQPSMQIQLARNHRPLKPCALSHLHPSSFPSQG